MERNHAMVRWLTAAGAPRRELFRWSIGALGSLLAFEAFSGCAEDEPRAEPARKPPSNPLPVPAAEGSGSAPRPDSTGGARAAAEDSAAMPSEQGQRNPCAKPTTFAPIVDNSLRSDFTRDDESDTLDWATIALALAARALELPGLMLSLLRGLGELRLGYPISLLDHSLQTATRARRAGASDDLVLGALCHHVGMAFTIDGYAELSASILRPFVADDVYRVVRHHAEYEWKHLAQVSALPSERRAHYAAQPWHAAAERFSDDWDCLAYDPSFDTLPLSEFEPLLWEKLALGTLHNCIDSGVCC